MSLTAKQMWQLAHRRLLQVETENARTTLDTDIDLLLEALPLRLPEEDYTTWLRRGENMMKIIPLAQTNFHYITEIHRFAADTRQTEDALPETPLTTLNQQFRLSIEALADNKIKIKLEALGMACSRYANKIMGISGTQSNQHVFCYIVLDSYGDGHTTLENEQAIRQALLRPSIWMNDGPVNA